MGVANNDMMIAEILKGKEVDLMKLREDYENRCGQLQLELQEVFEQNAKLAAYYKKKINSIEEQKKELASELETHSSEEQLLKDTSVQSPDKKTLKSCKLFSEISVLCSTINIPAYSSLRRHKFLTRPLFTGTSTECEPTNTDRTAVMLMQQQHIES